MYDSQNKINVGHAFQGGGITSPTMGGIRIPPRNPTVPYYTYNKFLITVELLSGGHQWGFSCCPGVINSGVAYVMTSFPWRP